MDQLQTPAVSPPSAEAAAGTDILCPGSGPLPAPFCDLDHLAGAARSRVTLGFSPTASLLAGLDWSLHWAASPGKRLRTALEIYRDSVHFWGYALRALVDDAEPDPVPPAPEDHRFRAPAWREWPFRMFAQSFLLTEKWCTSATRGVLGVSPHHEQLVSFAARQWLDMFSPSNHPLTNPQVLERTLQRGGTNFLEGLGNAIDDATRHFRGQPPPGSEAFEVGRTVAITPGRVVYRNHLIELIQYAPNTAEVGAEPVLFVPAWIMKYYILDLAPPHSLIRYLVGQGHTVYCISWRNPTRIDRDVGLEDYVVDGVMAALDAVGEIQPQRRVQAVGYCIGGTLLMIAAAAMARDRDERLASITLFAAQTDFTEPGELGLFIDESQIGVLESMMWARGVLESDQMAGAFQILQSNDLVWSRLIHAYLMGERRPVNDLMAWNADGTRMPYRMHAEYLRSLFLNNDLAASRLHVGGRPVGLQVIRVPIFCVGTEGDRIAPWLSVYKLHFLADTEVSFLLTDGGHNGGIICGPENPRRHYRLSTLPAIEAPLPADEWLAANVPQPGSWWPAWQRWLQQHTTAMTEPPPLGAPVDADANLDAPGTYVHER